MSATPRPSGSTSDTPLLLLVGGLAGAGASVWLAASVGGLLAQGRWPRLGLSDAARAGRLLAQHPGQVASAFPPALRPGLPGPVVFYAVLVVWFVLLAAAAVFALQFHHRSRSSPGWATRSQIRRHLSARAVQDKAPLIRPSLAGTRPDPRSVGIHLGRDHGAGSRCTAPWRTPTSSSDHPDPARYGPRKMPCSG